MNKHTRGFTLIELVVVISIIGILAATALPRYINLQTQARVAKAQAIYGAMKSAAALARANCSVDLATNSTPSCTSTGGTTTMDGLAITMVNQYPDASGNGIIAATQINQSSDGVTVTGTGPIVVTINGATTPASCNVTYSAAGAGPAAPAIVPSTGGC